MKNFIKIVPVYLLTLFFVFFVKIPHLKAHIQPPSRYIIIETDGSPDDLRAISMLFADNANQILGIIGSGGAVSAYSSCTKARNLLFEYAHQGIPVAMGTENSSTLPYSHLASDSVSWGMVAPKSKFETADELLNRITKHTNYTITLIALGSMSTYAQWLKKDNKNPKRIDRILWYGNFDSSSVLNLAMDKNSAEYIKNSGIQIECFKNNIFLYPIDTNYINHLIKIKSVYGQNIVQSHSHYCLQEYISADSLHMWSDVIPLYLGVPIIFQKSTIGNISSLSMSKNLPAEFIYSLVTGILSEDSPSFGQVFRSESMPEMPFVGEIVAIKENCIAKNGIMEWENMVHYTTWHGYSNINGLLAVKMITRLKEYFDAPGLALEIYISQNSDKEFANAASLCNGDFLKTKYLKSKHSESMPPIIYAVFFGTKVMITLKPELWKRVLHELDELEAKQSEKQKLEKHKKYFLEKWESLDRNTAFEILPTK